MDDLKKALWDAAKTWLKSNGRATPADLDRMLGNFALEFSAANHPEDRLIRVIIHGVHFSKERKLDSETLH